MSGAGAIANQWAERLGGIDPARAVGWASGVLAVIVGAQAAMLGWRLLEPVGPFGVVAPARAASAAQPADLTALRFDPFFRTAAASPSQGPDVSQLGLVLFAVRVGGPDGGAAIVQAPGRGQRSYSIGEEVAPGVVVRAVSNDVVTLEQNGAPFELRFPNGFGSNETVIAPSAREGAPAGEAMLRVAPTINPAALIGELALQARIENGEVTGYTLREGRAGPIMQRLGLQPGDVLLEVNNHRLLDDDRVAELQEELTSRPEAVIRFERNGEVKTATVRITLQ